ncbi:MAG TPA: hypothetical protein VET27_04025 [Mycobacterium sp.]|nr:hypothetical protein [Mycobacterium sp.]
MLLGIAVRAPESKAESMGGDGGAFAVDSRTLPLHAATGERVTT